MKIIAIGSHFDDIEIGCSGTILKHIKMGDCVKLYVLKRDETLTGNPQERYREQLNSLHMMGIDINVNKKESLQYLKTFESNVESEMIVNDIDRENPDILFVPWEFDTHQDHRRASLIGQSAGRKRHIETFFYSSGSTYNFSPNIFNPIEFLDKELILNCFKSQLIRGTINIDIIKKREAYWASMISTTISHAEGFIARKVKYPHIIYRSN